MAFFKCFKKGTVTILEDESDNRDEGTTLLVGAPLIASEVSEVDNSLHIPFWSQEVFCQLSSFKKSRSTDRDLHSTVLQLKSSHHIDTGSSKAFELLSDRIHNGAVNWGSAIPTAGESTFTEYYWEWLEDVLSRNTQVLKSTGLYDVVFASLFSYDRHAPVIRAFCEYWCPATNTLHMSQGEMSISLWDLHEIGGLPITGRFYDEVIPTTESLNRKDHKGVSYIPHICRYLFLAYHKILRGSKGKSGVRMTAWIKYWYRGPFKYKKSSRKTVRNKSQKPKEDSDPSVYSHWKSCLKIGSASTITLPSKDNIREFEVTSDYVIWWSKVHRFESTKSKTISTVSKSSSLSQPKSFKSQGNETLVYDKLTRGRALQVHPEVEGSSNTPVPRVQHLPPADVPLTQVPNDKGETESVADSQEDFIPLGRRIRHLKRGHISSNEDSEVNFRHKKTSIEPLYCDPDMAYPLDDTFFCDVSAISQPVLMNEGEVVHHVPTVSELVPFNHLPIEGENDTLHRISGSGASLRGILPNSITFSPPLLKSANHASTSEMSCGEPKLGVADKTLRIVISVLGNQIKSIILKASLERLPSFKDELGKLLTTLDNVGADVSSLQAMIDALMVTAVDYHSAHSSYSQKLSPEA
ncbi:unnamed protein product [Prunus brigantina]